MPTIKSMIEDFAERNRFSTYNKYVDKIIYGKQEFSLIMQDELLNILDKNVIRTTKKELTESFNLLIDWLRNAVENNNTKGSWGEDYKEKMREVLSGFTKIREDILIFVYGTLMRGNSNHRFLSNGKFIGKGIVNGFSMYDLGYFPGVKDSKEGIIKGEIYKIDSVTLMDLDRLEGEGSLYSRETTLVSYNSQEIKDVYIYVYNGSVSINKLISIENQPWNRSKQ